MSGEQGNSSGREFWRQTTGEYSGRAQSITPLGDGELEVEGQPARAKAGAQREDPARRLTLTLSVKDGPAELEWGGKPMPNRGVRISARPRRSRPAAFAALLFILCASPLPGAPGDEHWDTRFAATGYGVGLLVAAGGGNVYLAGNFTQIGGVAANHIARWDGTNWHPLGTGVYSTVTGLAATDRYVYAAGGFIGGGVGRWDGTNWTLLGQSLYPVVLGAGGDDVYAADARSAGPFGPYIYKWTGTNWEALGGGLWGAFCPEVSMPLRAIAVNGKDVYVGGRFQGLGGATNLAKWDGTNWSAVGGGVDLVDTSYGTCEVVSSLVFDHGRLYVGGKFNRAGAVVTNVANIACWDGTNWFTFNGGLGQEYQQVNALAVIHGAHVYAGGNFQTPTNVGATSLARWDGSAWKAMGSGFGSGAEASSLAVLNTDLFVVGTFALAGNQPAANIAIWHQDQTSPRIHAVAAGAELRLEWPSRYTSYRLQEATNPAGPWLIQPPVPPSINDLVAVTNRLTGRDRYFRLISE